MAVTYLDHDRPVAFAHRGGAARNPENTWRAFEYSAGLGYAYLETDIRTTSDDTLIAFHDATLDRVTDHSGVISKMTYREVSAARVAGTEEIPRLEDLLGTFPDLRFTIDLKDNGNPGPLARVLRRTRAWDRVCIASLSAQRLLAAQRSLDRPVCLAVTPVAFAAVRYGGLAGTSFAARLARSGALCAQVPRRIATREFVRRAHALGLQVHVWTLNTRWEIQQALDRGADGVMTDDVVLLRDILIERGQWHPGGRPPVPPDARPMAENAILSAVRPGERPSRPPMRGRWRRPPSYRPCGRESASPGHHRGSWQRGRRPQRLAECKISGQETRPKRGWMTRARGILSGYPVLPLEIANRLGGSK